MRTEALWREAARIAALCTLALSAAVLAASPSAAGALQPAWTTYHLDAGRSGAAPAYGEPVEPARAWQSADLGAPVWGQPLVLGGRVYVATTGDTLYALEASTGAVIWKKRLGVPVPASELECGDIVPTVGVVGTPVLDPARETIYAVADTWEPSSQTAAHVLKGYTLGGKQVLSVPVDPPGANPKTLLQRTALNLDNGNIVFGFGGNKGDCGEYRGAVVSVGEEGSAPSFWDYTPAAPATGGGAVWSPSGPAVAPGGEIYAGTGNPNTEGGAEASTYDLSDSILKLEPSLALAGHFEPPTWLFDSNHDVDLGSSGPELLPEGILFAAGKNGTGYLIEESTMALLYSAQVCGGSRSFGGDSYSEGVIYVPCQNGVQALSYDSAEHTFTPLWQGPADAFGPPIVAGGSVWVAATGGFAGGGTKLYALDPATGEPRWTETLPQPIADHFASPSAAGGRVFIATGSSVTAYTIEREPGPAPLAPEASTGASSAVTEETALLAGTVNPLGHPVSNCVFEYGTTTAYGDSAQCEPEPGEGAAALPLSALVTGLIPGTTYHYRLVASGPGGTTDGTDATFKTSGGPPVVETGAAASVTQRAAMLHGVVEPEGQTIEECFFRYGRTTSYGSGVSCSTLPATSEGAVAVAAPVSGLTPATSYQYRLVVRAGGIDYSGANATFETQAEPAPEALVPQLPGTDPATALTAVTPPPAAGSAGAAKPVASVASGAVHVSAAGRFSLLVHCTGSTEPCAGTLTLRGSGSGGRTLASKRFSAAAGTATRVHLKLGAKALARLLRTGSVRVRVAVVTTSAAGAVHSPSVLVRLRSPRSG